MDMEVVSDRSSSPETVLPVPTAAAAFVSSPHPSNGQITQITGGNPSEASTASYRIRCAKRGEGLAHSSFLVGEFNVRNVLRDSSLLDIILKTDASYKHVL